MSPATLTGTPEAPRIGVFGGSFDPIHRGHVAMAVACRKAMGLSRVCVVPVGAPPHKQRQLASPRDRLHMVHLAVAGDPGFEVSDVEIRRPGPSYTLDTLNTLARERPTVRWTLILGLDTLLGMGTWHRPGDVVRHLPMGVPFRPGHRFAELVRMPLLGGVDFTPLADSAVSRWDAAPHRSPPPRPVRLTAADGIDITLVPMVPLPYSATAIRTHIHTGRRPGRALSSRVAAYIIRRHLYV